MHAFQLSTVQANALRYLVDSLTSVFSGEVDINIDAFTRIDKAGHPTTTNGAGVTVSFDIKVLEYCASPGEIFDIVVEDMERQARELKG